MTKLQKIAIAAGYADRVDIKSLLDDIREVPGGEKIKRESLVKYLDGRQIPPLAKALALAEVLGCELDDIVSARRRGYNE